MYSGEGSSNNGPTTQGSQDIAPTVNVLQQEVMTFIEEGSVAKDQLPMPLPGRGFLAPAKDSLANQITGFLSRPLLIRRFQWTSSSTRGAKLFEEFLPRDWLQFTAIREKLAGFRYLRCNFHVRVQVNAQQFNAGRLLLVWQPFWNQLGSTPSSSLTVAGITGLPIRADLDLSDSTSVEIEVPYVSTTSHYDLVTGLGTSGAVQVYVYSALTGLAEVDATVWCWATDIDVQLPTGLSPVLPTYEAQSDFATPTGENPENSYQELDSRPTETRLDKEKRPKVISKILDVGGKVAMALGSIPSIGPFAIAGGAIARGIGKLASLWGWSKPIVDEIPTQVRNIFVKTMANYNGIFDGKILAFDYDNQTDIPTFMFGTDQDEMAFDYILKRPVFTDAFTMSDTSLAGALLWKWPVDPMSCRKFPNPMVNPPTGYNPGVQSFNTYMSYFGNLFMFWRGMICYQFKIIKTIFHTGRIMVLYCPGADLTTDTMTIEISKCYKKVVDLRLNDTFDFCVPYNWLTPWKEMLNDPVDITNQVLVNGRPTGMIYVFVVNALRNPSSAADQIEFIVESYAGDDFQFAVPGRTAEVYPLLDTLDTVTELSEVSRYQAQSDFMFENPTPSDDVGINALGVGECIKSLRQLLKRYFKLSPDTIEARTTNSYVRLYRNMASEEAAADPAAALARLRKFNDIFRWVASIYRLQCGPMRLSVMNNFNSTDSYQSMVMVPAIEYGNNRPDYETAQLLDEGILWSKVDQVGPTEPALEAEVPFYQNFPAILTELGNPAEYSTNSVLPTNRAFRVAPNNKGTALFFNSADGYAKAKFYRHTGERHSFGMLLGPPPTIAFGTGS